MSCCFVPTRGTTEGDLKGEGMLSWEAVEMREKLCLDGNEG